MKIKNTAEDRQMVNDLQSFSHPRIKNLGHYLECCKSLNEYRRSKGFQLSVSKRHIKSVEKFLETDPNYKGLPFLPTIPTKKKDELISAI